MGATKGAPSIFLAHHLGAAVGLQVNLARLRLHPLRVSPRDRGRSLGVLAAFAGRSADQFSLEFREAAGGTAKGITAPLDRAAGGDKGETT